MKTIFKDKNNRLRSGWKIALFVILVVAVVAVINVGWRALGLPGKTVDGIPQPWTFFSFAALISVCVFGVMLLMLRYFEGLGPTAIGMPFEHKALWQTFFGVWLGALPIGAIVGLAVGFGYGDVTFSPSGVWPLTHTLIPILGAVLVLAAWEEFVLRGYVFRQLSLGISPVAAVAITGLVFGLLHSANPDASWQGVLYTVIGGMMMGWLLLRSGSLWLLIGYHFGWNAMSSAVFGLDLSGLEADASIFNSSLTGPEILTGGAYGFEASLPAVVAEVVILSLAVGFVSRRKDSQELTERAAVVSGALK